MTHANRPSRGRGRPPTYANPTEREREKKRRQRAKELTQLRRSVGLDRLATALREFESQVVSHISLDDALSDPEIGPQIGPIMSNAARIQRALEVARGPRQFATAVERLGGRKRVSIALRAASRELDELNAAFRAVACSKCGNVLILEDNRPFVAGDAIFVTCPRCGTLCYFGAAVMTPLEQRRELGTLLSAPTDGEPPALAVLRAAGGLSFSDQGGALGSGGGPAADRAYKGQIEAVIGRKITWREYNHSYRPRAKGRGNPQQSELSNGCTTPS